LQADLNYQIQNKLTPRVEVLKEKIKGSTSVGNTMKLGGAVLGGVIAYLNGGSLEASIAAAGGAKVALDGAALVIEKAMRRFNKSGRKAACLAEFYGELLESNK
jgi:hypothetical protein